ITLPWRPDAAEHYFAPVNHLPWAMLLHSGDAIHPYNRFDILVGKIYLDARMNQAIKLLRMGAGNISQVATMCGYDTPSYFIAIF
ncbi:hypothetical protein MJI95_37115, partial [Salmonella enterica subsp. enterica serovar Kentucky]|nr:hypothetical protein [Salmonella enterica subsp. enterica serovar Kentucky]